MAAPFYIATSSVWGCQFLHILISIWCDLRFRVQPFSWVWVVSHGILIYTWGFLRFWKVTILFPCLFLCLDSHRPIRSSITPASEVDGVWRKLPSRGPSLHWPCPSGLLMTLQSLAGGPTDWSLALRTQKQGTKINQAHRTDLLKTGCWLISGGIVCPSEEHHLGIPMVVFIF